MEEIVQENCVETKYPKRVVHKLFRIFRYPINNKFILINISLVRIKIIFKILILIKENGPLRDYSHMNNKIKRLIEINF